AVLSDLIPPSNAPDDRAELVRVALAIRAPGGRIDPVLPERIPVLAPIGPGVVGDLQQFVPLVRHGAEVHGRGRRPGCDTRGNLLFGARGDVRGLLATGGIGDLR